MRQIGDLSSIANRIMTGATKHEGNPNKDVPYLTKGSGWVLVGPGPKAPTIAAKHLKVPDYEQGPNECGHNSLKMVYEYYGMSDKCDLHYNYFTGTSIRDMEEYAEDHGMQAGVINNANINDITQFLDRGMPVILEGRNNGDGAEHYIVVSGYEKRSDGSLSFDVSDGDADFHETWTQDEVETHWRKNYVPGGSNLLLVMAPNGSEKAQYVPETDLNEAEEMINTIEAGNDVLHGLVNVLYPFDMDGDFIGWGEWAKNIPGGVLNIAGGAASMPFQLPALGLDKLGGWIGGPIGDFLDNWSGGMSEFGYDLQNMVEDFPRDPLGSMEDLLSVGTPLDTLEKVVEDFPNDPLDALADVISFGIDPFGMLDRVISDGVHTVAGALEDGWDFISDGVGDAWNAVEDGVGDAWDAVEDGVGDAWDAVGDAAESFCDWVGGLF